MTDDREAVAGPFRHEIQSLPHSCKMHYASCRIWVDCTQLLDFRIVMIRNSQRERAGKVFRLTADSCLRTLQDQQLRGLWEGLVCIMRIK